jgi:RNA polymerase sigma factor (sigma-70 family)
VEHTSIQLLARWQAGDQQAAEALFDRFAGRLAGVAARRLPAQMLPHTDPEDVVQSVFRCFFVAARKGHYVLRQSGDLWRLLLAITLNKIHHQFRHYQTAKRAIEQEQHLGDPGPESCRLRELLSKEAAPDETVMLGDLLEQVLRSFAPLQRRTIELRLQGYRLEEIAADTGRGRTTVKRVLERFRQILEHEYSVSSG